MYIHTVPVKRDCHCLESNIVVALHLQISTYLWIYLYVQSSYIQCTYSTWETRLPLFRIQYCSCTPTTNINLTLYLSIQLSYVHTVPVKRGCHCLKSNIVVAHHLQISTYLCIYLYNQAMNIVHCTYSTCETRLPLFRIQYCSWTPSTNIFSSIVKCLHSIMAAEWVTWNIICILDMDLVWWILIILT
jgi:hypothetical protein